MNNYQWKNLATILWKTIIVFVVLYGIHNLLLGRIVEGVFYLIFGAYFYASEKGGR